MGKKGIAPGQKLPKGATIGPGGKLILPPNPPVPQIVKFRPPRNTK